MIATLYTSLILRYARIPNMRHRASVHMRHAIYKRSVCNMAICLRIPCFRHGQIYTDSLPRYPPFIARGDIYDMLFSSHVALCILVVMHESAQD